MLPYAETVPAAVQQPQTTLDQPQAAVVAAAVDGGAGDGDDGDGDVNVKELLKQLLQEVGKVKEEVHQMQNREHQPCNSWGLWFGLKK